MTHPELFLSTSYDARLLSQLISVSNTKYISREDQASNNRRRYVKYNVLVSKERSKTYCRLNYSQVFTKELMKS